MKLDNDFLTIKDFKYTILNELKSYTKHFTKKKGIKVYYYDVIEDRTKKTKNFRQIEDLLSKYLKITDMGAEYLFTPALIFVKDGKIINYDDETSLVSYDMQPSTYWNSDTVNDFHNKINTYLSEADYN